MAEVPVKPGVFKCPEDFESREYLESDTSIDSEDDDYELVLISAPNDLEFALLDGEELPIRGVEHLRLNKENGIENLRVESLKTDKSSNLTLLLPQKGKIVPAKKFTHYVSITKDIEVPSISFPPSSRNVQELPDGLKQRYTAFGAGDPIVTVGEKDVIKRKKRSSKREKASEHQETMAQSSQSKVTREKLTKSSREDDDDTVPQVETKKKVSRRIKKAKTSSDEEIPIQIEKPLKKVSRKKKESNLEESTNASSSDSVGKLSSKEKMKLTAEYINQLDTEIVSASPSTSSKKKTSNVPVLEADAAEKKIRKPKKSSGVETKSKKEKKTSKRNKDDDDDEDENRRKAKEDLINEIMYSKSPKSRVRKIKTDSHIASFSQEH